MSEKAEVPRTARDALLIELLGDVGCVHDSIKELPSNLRSSIKESLNIIVEAVGKAEAAAEKLQKETNESIKNTATRVAFEAGSELSNAIQKSLENTFEPSLNRASKKIDDLQRRVESLAGNTRDIHATRMNYILLIGFVLALLSTLGGVSWLAIVSQENNEVNKWFYNDYKAQRAIIDSLPPNIKKKFEAK